MRTALVIVHLSTIDSYAWTIGEEKARQLADRIVSTVRKHKGPVYIVDQFWDGALRDKIAGSIADIPVKWIRFDEDVESWDRFLPALKKKLSRDKVTDAVVGGVWFDPTLKEGCATEVYVYLSSLMPTTVNKSIVGCMAD